MCFTVFELYIQYQMIKLFLHLFMQEVTDELKNYESTLAALHEQAANLGEQDRESPDIQNRLGSIDNRYQELLELAKLRKQRLLDALSLYKLFNEADGVETWIDEKVCVKLFLLLKIEEAEVILHFFSHNFVICMTC